MPRLTRKEQQDEGNVPCIKRFMERENLSQDIKNNAWPRSLVTFNRKARPEGSVSSDGGLTSIAPERAQSVALVTASWLARAPVNAVFDLRRLAQTGVKCDLHKGATKLILRRLPSERADE